MNKQEEEIWIELKVGKGAYSVSSMGRMYRIFNNRCSIINGSKNKEGYLTVKILIGGKYKTFNLHSLIADTFLLDKQNGNQFVVDHIDENKINNAVSNLRIITQRKNVSKSRNPKTSYTGVYNSSTKGKYLASILINKKKTHLGTFNTSKEAHTAYINAVNTSNL